METNHDRKKHVSDRRRITLDEAMHGKLIPMFGGRPEREQVIGKDDLMNLKIAFNTCNDVNQFLEVV
jgi:hypothetical protein